MIFINRKRVLNLLCYGSFGTRHCHTENQLIRVRFAPSPTGYLHLGGLRTALYNFLFAKANNGQFLLRIEDTDQSRLVEDATEQLCKDLEWAGIIPDEGPAYGGNYGPYLQSERVEIYKEQVKKLLGNGSAYYCFCSDRRLEMIRREALRARQVPKYDNRCRHLTPVQIAQKLAKNDKYCIRFKLKSKDETFKDLIYGDITYDVAQNEGDPVIIKTDGFPTYHFANVVDDHMMKISHVMRGIEWQISTPKHILIYKAFGWKPPQYAHLPLILNADGSKLSKRQGDIRIGSFRDQGILPQALLNFITQSGGGFEQIADKKIRSHQMKELVERFNINRINVHSSRLNFQLLNDCNRSELLQQIEDPEKCEKLIVEVCTLVQSKYPQYIEDLDLNRDHVRNILKWAGHRVSTIKELVDGKLSFLWILPKLTKDTPIDKGVLDSLIADLEAGNFNKVDLQTMLKQFSTKNNLTFSSFMKTLRNLLSGLKEGPGVAEMMEILGKENTLSRILRNRKKS